jgi:hypothetical protein
MPISEPSTALTRRRGRRYVLALVAVFLASRYVYWLAGVRFDSWALTNSWQLLPQDLLRNDLVRSLWYLHSQPPLWNAFIGATLQFPHAHGLINIEFVVCTLALTVLLFFTMVELAVPMPLAFVTATLFVISPTTVLYENWMYYTYPVALLSVGAVWCFARYVRTKRVRYAAGVGTLLALLALTRASYHLIFVIVGAAAVVVAAPTLTRRRVLVAVGIPVLAVGGLYIKNYVLFGEPAASSWLGMNLAHSLLGNQPEAVRADVDRGKLSPQALTPAFIGINSYPFHPSPTGVPALDRPEKAPGVNNYNNLAYIDVSRQYQKDAVTFIERHPDLYARTVGDAFRTMFVPASDFFGVQIDKQNFAELRGALDFENGLLGQRDEYRPPAPGELATTAAPDARHIAWMLVFAYAASLLAAAVVAVRSIRRRRWSVPGATLVFLAFVVTFSMFSSNMFELGENMRFRLETDPLVFAAMAALLARAWTFVRGGRLLPAGREPVTVELDDVDADHALGDAPANGRSDSRTETEPSHR